MNTWRCALRTLSAAGFGVLLTACVPIPHMDYYAPRISGVVLEGGQPVSHAELRLSATPTDRVIAGTTDASGHFEIGPIRKLRWMTWFIGDQFFRYTLQIARLDTTVQGLDAHSTGSARVARSVTCDISVPHGPPGYQTYCVDVASGADPAR